MGDTTAKPAGDPPAFEPITTQEAADAYVAAHPPADYEQALARARDLEERLAVSDRALMAARVSAATGVPASAITGATRQEMEASAAALRMISWRDASAPKPARTAPLRRPGLRSGAAGSEAEPLSPKAAAAAAVRRMRGRN